MYKVDTSHTFETQRLKMRFLSEDDAGAIFDNLANDREVLRYFIMPYAEDREAYSVKRITDSSVDSNRYTFAICLKDTEDVIGLILQVSAPSEMSNCCEIGYAIGRKYWNKGYVTEALSGMLKFLFSLGIHRVYACHFPENKASCRVMEKCGMVCEGTHHGEVYLNGKYHDMEYHYILNNPER